jgi:glutamate racemase
MKIGVFDSGIGGKAIADSLARDFPEAEIIYIHDSEHVPYGGREETEIIKLTETALKPILEGVSDCIVIACNTVTAAAIEYLREKYPREKFIGLEPMVKPAAALTKSGVIAICATPYTLQSNRYQGLKELYAKNVEIIEPDCSEWAAMIERNSIDSQIIQTTVQDIVAKKADVIVLACTHYHWIKELIINEVGDKVKVLDPSEAISRRVASLLLG